MQIFLAGAVSVANDKQLNKYNVYKDILEKYGKLTVPDDIWAYRENCIKMNPNASKLEIDRMMVEYDLSRVKNSDLVVCDLSMQSTGMGLELGVVYENKNKIIFCYEKGSYISNMITGAFSGYSFIEYLDLIDLKNQLTQLIDK
jgi:hypothetical protein